MSATLEGALAAGDWVQARTLLEAALADPDSDKAVVHAMLGKVQERAGEAAAARGHYLRARELGHREALVTARLGALMREDDALAAANLLDAALHEPECPHWAAALLGEIADEELGDPVWAVRALRQAEGGMAEVDRLVRLARAAVDAQDMLAATQAAIGLTTLEAPREALLAALEKLIVFEPGLVDPATDRLIDRLPDLGVQAPSVALIRARRALGLHDHARALSLARQAAAVVGFSAPLRLFEAELLLALGELEEAEQGLEQAARGVTIPTDTWLALADALRQREQLDHAVAVARRATQERPDNAGAWVELARIEADLGREQDGQAALAQAIALDPEIDREAGRIHGLARELIGGLPSALTAWGLTMTTLRRVRFGHNAVVFEVDAPERRFVKAYMPGLRSARHVAATTELLAHLSESPNLSISVPRPTRRSDGALTGLIAGCETFVMDAAPGEGLRRTLADPRRLVTLPHAEGLGGALAALQRGFAKIDDWDAPASSGMTAGLGAFARAGVTERWRERVTQAGLGLLFPGLVAEAVALLGRLEDRAVAAVQALPRGLVHGDFGWHNVLWDGARPVAVIDFDYAAWDHPLGDLVNAILRTAFDWKRLLIRTDPAARLDVAQAIVRGYRAAGGIVPVDADALEALLAALRVEYYTSMALSGARASTAHADPRTPRTYPRAADTLRVLVGQLHWLEQHRGLGAEILG